MASRERSIVVRLRAIVDDFKAKMGEAGRAVDQVGQRAQETGKRGGDAMQRLAQHARDNTEAYQTAGRALVVFGGAITGLGAAVLRTGISYNSLQQSSRAALTALLGSAEAANAQMDRLDEFARNSPFAKQVFISAQRQLLGFGVEARKVIPYLDAIQNAVAATGGSNQDIAELVRIFSQVQAAAKITAVDLMQFGQRGVDAATLIGSQMGMTGAQVRNAITEGTLDAQLALDALANGMQERFGGAAANVKNTFEGALDRVKAAWRDFAATLTAPLVDPEGGGALVDFLNNVADAMRQFQAMPDWAQTFIGGATGLVGALSLVGGTALIAVPKIVAFRDALQTMNVTARRAAIGAGIATAAVGALAAAITLWATKTAESRERARTYADAVQEVGDAAKRAITEVAALNIVTGNTVSWGLWEQARSGYSSLAEALEGLGSSAEEAAMAVAGTQEEFDAYIASLNDGAFSLADVEVAAKLREQREAIAAQREEADRLAATNEALGDTQLDLAEATGQSAAAAEEAAKAFQDQVKAVADADASFIDLLGAYQDLVDKNIEVAQATADATESAEDSWEDFYDGVTVSLRDWIAALEEQVAAQQSWEQNMLLLAGRVSQGVLDELARMGPEGAPLVAELVNASDEELARLEDVFSERAGDANQSFADTLVRAQPILAAIGRQLGDEAAAEAAASIAAGEATIQETIDRYSLEGVTFPVDANTDPAAITLANFRAAQARQALVIQARVDANPNYSPARADVPVRRAGGGAVFGPGTERSDSIPAWLSNNEHVLSAEEVRGLGGHGEVERLRAMARTGTAPRFADGGSPWSRPIIRVDAPTAPSGPLVHVERVVEGTPADVGREVQWALIGRV